MVLTATATPPANANQGLPLKNSSGGADAGDFDAGVANLDAMVRADRDNAEALFGKGALPLPF